MSRYTRTNEIADDLERRIRQDEFEPHTNLPSLATLGSEYKASEGTIVGAIKVLARKGFVTSVRAYGTVVLDWRRPRQTRRCRKVYKDDRGFYFDEVAKSWQPIDPASRVTWESADGYIADLLGIEYGSEVLIRERAIGEPVEIAPGRRHITPQQVCSTTVPGDIAREHDLGRENTGQGGVLFRLEEIYGDLEFKDVSYARMPTAREVEVLQLGSGDTPVLGLATVVTAKVNGESRVVVVNDVRMDGRRWFSEHPLKKPTTRKTDTGK